MQNQQVSDEYLNSFIDNQLDTADQLIAFYALVQNNKLKERACELRTLKELVQHAYLQPRQL